MRRAREFTQERWEGKGTGRVPLRGGEIHQGGKATGEAKQTERATRRTALVLKCR